MSGCVCLYRDNTVRCKFNFNCRLANNKDSISQVPINPVPPVIKMRAFFNFFRGAFASLIIFVRSLDGSGFLIVDVRAALREARAIATANFEWSGAVELQKCL